MAVDELIDDRIALKQIQKAVKALHEHESKKQKDREEKELLPGKEPNIWLNVTVKQVAPKNKIKPVKIPIVHPLVDPRTTSICLITKDPQREYKDLLEQHNIKFISRVVGIAKLKGKFKSFEARRLLLKENGLFLADERVIPLLPKLLGSKWFEAKKQPIPVCLTRKDLKGELERAISSTYMHQNNGTCTAIKIGALSQKPEQIIANVQKAIPAIAAHIPGGWDNIQSFFIKTNSSVALPIWNCNLGTEKGGRWSGLVKEGEEERKEIDSDEEESQNRTTRKGQKKSMEDGKSKAKQGSGLNRKKRMSEGSDDDESEDEKQPRKKAKSSTPSSNTPVTATSQTPSASKPPKVHSKSSSEATNVSNKASKPKSKMSQTPNTSTDQVTTKTRSEQLSSSQKTSKEKDSGSVSHKASNADQTGKEKTQSQPEKAEISSKTKKPDQNPVSGLTRDEWKKKRAAMSLLDKKKEKLMAAKGGKSTKAKVLGKKVLDS